MTPAELTARGVRVRKLGKWITHNQQHPEKTHFYTLSRYTVYRSSMPREVETWCCRGGEYETYHATPEAAKAAAQADYEARICAALATQEAGNA